ncbi:LysR family transcriptional regulator [Streptomyces sp. NPDC059786]|uniref:LysR family transcriptional regulator n=1 Tax=Streptomyces sp. NPDC059786 TaxID=3346946 RepID=UPI00364FAD8B
MDLIALRSFREVCRTGSISAAADTLGYTQSAVSRQVAALEARLGTPLLERHARGVRPTPAGEALLGHAVAILRRIEHAEQDVAALRDRPVARLRVGAVPSAAAALLPEALTRYAAAAPDVRVTFAEDVTPRLLPRLLDGELDAAVVTDYPPGLPAGAALALTHLLDDPLVCVLPRDHARAGQDVVDLAELAGETWVEDYDGAASVLMSACARAGFAPRIDIECGSWPAKQAFVAGGLGVMLAPRTLVPALRRDVAVRVLTDPPRRRVYAAVRRPTGAAPAPAADAFVAALLEAAAVTVERT